MSIKEEVGKQFDYAKKVVSTPIYKMQKISPQSSAAVSLTVAGGNETIFELPPKVYNPARSDIRFTVTPPSPPVPGAANTANWNISTLGQCSPIQQLQVIAKGSGTILCDISNFQYYTKVAWLAETSDEEYKNYDTAFHNNGRISYMRRNNGPDLNPATIIADRFAVQSKYSYRLNDSSQPSLYYDEMSYGEIGPAVPNGGVAAAGPTFNVTIPFRMFKNTVLELDKDIPFNDTIQIRIVWGSRDRVTYFVNDPYAAALPGPPVVNATPGPVDPAGGATTLPGDIPISNLNVYLAVETDLAIIQQLTGAVNSSGISIPINYVTAIRTPIGPGNQQHSITQFLGNPHGQRLLKIYHMLTFNTVANVNLAPPETLNLSFNTSLPGVIAGAGSYLFTQLDGNRLQDYNVDLSQFEDWAYNYSKFENSPIYNSAIYRQNWFWVEDFSNASELTKDEDENALKGIDLRPGRRYDFLLNGSAVFAANHYDFIVGQKMLTINSQGVQLN